MKRISKIVLWLLGIFVVLVLASPYIMSALFNDSFEKTWAAMDKVEFSCPETSEVTTRGWSKAGYMRYCEPKKNGPWEAWSEGYRQIQGEYQNGQKHGTWQWFNKKGEVTRTIVYSNGKEVQQ